MVTQYCTFRLDGFTFGIEVERVQEVIRYQDMSRVPLSSEVVRGLINLRGQIVTALDLRARLQLPPRPEGQWPMNVVVMTDDGPLSLLVDSIGEVVDVEADSFETPPETLDGVARDLIQGCHKLDGHLLLVLATDRAVSLPEPARS
ncbi:chemotaxis protein CheW [Egibacter rhizosphaerae]|uniref:Chemotaxis protein CheW n=2 Tax=Egibacter rhizosphaerae TaxID=1670831 RepID=A0A411YLL3_9ACTN|nr:chemotaxis protein CheW [Egibacter rhizosphaerae]